jgi:photosystem II stability/assembly factor-like uncharacterized protein
MPINSTIATYFSRRAAGYVRSRWGACAIVLVLAMALAACDSSPTPTPITNPQATATVRSAPTPGEPTSTPKPSATATHAPPTSTPTLEPSATPTASPTEAPLPQYTWKSLGLPEGTNLRDIALLTGGKNLVLVASPAGVWRTEYDYSTWQKLDVPIPGNPRPGNVEVAIGSADIMYVTAHTACASGLPINSFRSIDGGLTWTALTVELLDVYAPSANIAYGTTCSGVLKTTDSGATWSGVLPGSEGEGHDPYGITGSPDGESVYVAYASEGGTGTMRRSTDGGATWADITPQNVPPDGTLRAAVHMMFVPGSVGRPDDGGLYMANGQGTFFLPTESDEWQVHIDTANAVNDPPYYVTALYVDTAYSADYVKNGPILYTARAKIGERALEGIGVFRSTNLGATWQMVGDDIGKRSVQGLALAPHDTTAQPDMVEALIAATSDGAWGILMPGR